ncbi:Crp/Fnr family transcriptional regulator [Notoacmeibacter ruber]|uniref:Crp/Fnr family transcriptional regulator n=1 Tax=Notoacmeibacter ruber TaxID=2670375 RepID=A0A3L7JFJ0_9HYPH|nr:Crp/Fnr family transcriptional regulator [Notoacmeibacter ruber]
MKKLDESLLSDLPPFSQLDGSQIREILDLAKTKRFEENVTVFEEGAEAERFYLLLDGTVRALHVTPEGEHVTALHVPAGQLFGFAAAFGRSTYPATVETAAEAVTLWWPMSLWPQFVARYPGFATESYRTIGQRLNEMQTRVVELSVLHVEQRVARTLLRLIQQSGRQEDGGIVIDFPITRRDLSDMTGTTLHTVSRLLSGWEKKGVVQSERKHITVCKPERLHALSEGRPV